MFGQMLLKELSILAKICSLIFVFSLIGSEMIFSIFNVSILNHCFVCKVLKEVLSSNSSKQVDPDFGTTRESILQVRNITRAFSQNSAVDIILHSA